MTFIIKGVLDRFEETQAIIKTEDGTELLWPANKLPEDVTAGASLKITIAADTHDTDEKQELAKNMLNEILNNEQEELPNSS